MKKFTKLFFLVAMLMVWGNVVNAQNTNCAGTSAEPSTPVNGGTFTLGYNYAFTTTGTDVKVEFELLDEKIGLVAYAFTYNPNFAETSMTNVGGKKFSKTFTGQTLGAEFKVACKFAFAGGMAVTKTFTYTVGDACGGTISDNEVPTAFTASLGAVSASSVELLLKASDNSGAVVYTVSYGSTPTTVSTTGTSGTEKSFVVTGLIPGTAYTFSVVAKDAAGNAAANNPLTVVATTTAMTAAPTPTVDASKVISMFSNAYTNVPVNTWKTTWSVAGALTDMQIAGNDTKKYEGVTFVGIETTGANMIDASAMRYFNVDILTDNVTSLKIKLVDFGANGVWNGVGLVDDVEDELTFVPVLTGWNSYKIPLADFTRLTTKAHMAQYIITAAPAGTSSFYLDNMYFSTEAGTSVSSIKTNNDISFYPNPVMNQLTVSAQSEISQLIVRNLVGQTLKTVVVNGLVTSINLSDLSAGNYFVTTKLNNGKLSTQKVIKL